MSQDPVKKITPPLIWLTNIKSFFQLPNPKFFHLFIISSTVTFSLGVSMAVEWFLYGQYHLGFYWIAYYAPAIMALPILLWLTCLSSAIVFGESNQVVNLPPPPPSDQNTQLEQALESQDQLSVVEIRQPLHHHPLEMTNETVHSSLESVSKEGLKRSMSVPKVYTRYEFSKINRSYSFR